MTDSNGDIGSAGNDIPVGRVMLYCLAIVSGTAAVIHFVTAADYFQGYWLFSLSMLVIAWLQAAWAAVAVIRPSRGLLRAGAWLNAVPCWPCTWSPRRPGTASAPRRTRPGCPRFAAGLSAGARGRS